MYSFLFDRRSLTLFLCGLVVVGLLLFGTGVLIGVGLNDRATPAEPPPFRPHASEGRPTAAEVDPGGGEARGAPATPAEEPPPGDEAAERPGAAAAPSPAAQTGPGPDRESDRLAGPPADPEPEPEETLTAGVAPAAVGAGAPSPAKQGAPIEAAPERPSPAAPAPTEPVSSAKEAARPAPEVPSRVLPGPAPRRPAAESPAPAAESAAGEPATTGPGFAVQAGAFKRPDYARELADELARRGYEPYLVEIEVDGATLTAVLFGRFSDRATAVAAAGRFESREKRPALVRALP